uniref:ATP-dependent Clp protease proteolytic subunit n=1 Tax=Drypetes hainanensis TaxID=2763564 RepID=A0A7G8QCS6_9ROSI|nr:clp protease proteolytic subunit [Drypetes hainanensis]QNK04584.1 clp protease proteolytic subunit [Drypetes hainanensis]
MPVGIPKVPFEDSFDDDNEEEEKIEWLDIHTRLHRERILFLGKPIDDQMANTIIGLLVYLTIEDPHTDINLFIQSSGGLIVPGLGVYDMINHVGPDVRTIGLGLTASMASFILSGGAPTKRISFPHNRIMMHQPFLNLPEEADLTLGDLEAEMEELLRLREIIVEGYAHRTGKPVEIINEDIERDFFMTPEEAQAYGIIDSIGASSREVPFDNFQSGFDDSAAEAESNVDESEFGQF